MGSSVSIVDNSTNILDIIRADHAKIMVLSENIEILKSNNQSAEANQVFAQLGALASAHMAAEERVFYPSLENADKKIMLMAVEEHNLTRKEANDLKGIPIESDLWDAKFSVMTELTEHHIEEEQSAVFLLAKLTLSKQQLNDLGMQFRQEEMAQSK